MRVTLEIKDSKASAFLNFIKSLDFVKIKSLNDDEPTRDEILNSIKQGIKEVELHRSGEKKLRSAKDFLNEF